MNTDKTAVTGERNAARREQTRLAINPLCDEQLGTGPCCVCERERAMRGEAFLSRFDRAWPKFGQDWR